MAQQLAVSVWSLQQLTLTQGRSLDDLLGLIAGFGVDLVEINEDYLRLPPYDTTHGLRLLRRRTEEMGLSIASLWFYTDLIGASLLTSPKAVASQLGDYLATAALAGSPRITIPTGEGPRELPYKQGRAVLGEVLDRALVIAEDYGVDIGLEVGRSSGRFQTPEAALQLVTDLGSSRLRIVPDFEAWRHATADLPLTHVETTEMVSPSSMSAFAACLPYAPLIHAKLLRLDETGEEPHFPLDGLGAAICDSSRDHVLSLEFEGWIPDIDPDRDCIAETERCVALLRRLLAT